MCHDYPRGETKTGGWGRVLVGGQKVKVDTRIFVELRRVWTVHLPKRGRGRTTIGETRRQLEGLETSRRSRRPLFPIRDLRVAHNNHKRKILSSKISVLVIMENKIIIEGVNQVGGLMQVIS